MNTNRDLLRMRHVCNQQPGYKWDDYKKGFDALAGAVLVGGLVQALLLALKGSGETGAHMKKAAAALVDWLRSENAQCGPVVPPEDLEALNLQLFAGHLIELNDVKRAMAVQAEALRYLAQAKLVAGAFKDPETPHD